MQQVFENDDFRVSITHGYLVVERKDGFGTTILIVPSRGHEVAGVNGVCMNIGCEKGRMYQDRDNPHIVDVMPKD